MPILTILEDYVDEGESAKTSDRPAFRQMIKRCQKDKSIDPVIGSQEITLISTLTKPS